MKQTFTLAHAQARQRAAQAVLAAADGSVVTIGEPKRNGDQNAKLHAELGEIAERVKWAGALRSTETWKRLMTAAWLRARGESVEILPALDGHGVDVVFRRTSDLSKSEAAELIDFVCCWKAENMEPVTA